MNKSRAKEFLLQEAAQQVAELLCVRGSPLLLQRNAETLAYLYELEKSTSAVQIARRMLGALLLRVPHKEAKLIRLQRDVLNAALQEVSDPAEIFQAARAADEYLDWCVMGRGKSPRARAVLQSIEEPQQRRDFAASLRIGEFVEENGEFKFPFERGRRRGAILVSLVVFAYLLGLFASLAGRPSIDETFLTLLILASVICCGWLGWGILRSIRYTKDLVNKANDMKTVRRTG